MHPPKSAPTPLSLISYSSPIHSHIHSLTPSAALLLFDFNLCLIPSGSTCAKVPPPTETSAPWEPRELHLISCVRGLPRQWTTVSWYYNILYTPILHIHSTNRTQLHTYILQEFLHTYNNNNNNKLGLYSALLGNLHRARTIANKNNTYNIP